MDRPELRPAQYDHLERLIAQMNMKYQIYQAVQTEVTGFVNYVFDDLGVNPGVWMIDESLTFVRRPGRVKEEEDQDEENIVQRELHSG